MITYTFAPICDMITCTLHPVSAMITCTLAPICVIITCTSPPTRAWSPTPQLPSMSWLPVLFFLPSATWLYYWLNNSKYSQSLIFCRKLNRPKSCPHKFDKLYRCIICHDFMHIASHLCHTYPHLTSHLSHAPCLLFVPWLSAPYLQSWFDQ